MKKLYILFGLVCLATIYCQAQGQPSALEKSIDGIRLKHVPDKRIDVFDIKVSNDSIIGFTGSDVALKELKKLNHPTHIKLLPDPELGEKTYGVINLSAGDIREEAKFTSGMATQAMLGTPIRVLQKKRMVPYTNSRRIYRMVAVGQLSPDDQRRIQLMDSSS